MRILAIETVDTTGTVAALEGDRLLVERSLNPQQRSAQSLAPAIHDLLQEVAWQPGDLQLVAVATGPGSFTGLRIGVTTAKTLAYAVGCELLGIHTLAAIAWRVPADVPRFSAVLDAQRGEWFVADFVRQADGRLTGEETTRTVLRADWLRDLAATAITGPALAKSRGELPSTVTLLDESLWSPTATGVGQLAALQFAAGRREKLFDVLPQYFRRTAAEEQWDKKLARPGSA